MKYLELKLLSDGRGKAADSLQIARIVLGTDYFGTTVDEKTAFRLMDIYADAGGNCLDTARTYANWLPGGDGASERTVGRWIKSGKCRDRIVLSTKGGHPPLDDITLVRLSRKELEDDLHESLKTLGTDYIDIYWLHRDDESRPVEDIMETLTRFVSAGKIRAAACSNWKTKRIEQANRAAEKNGFVQFCASQIQWSLAVSTPELHNDLTIVCMDDSEYAWYLENKFPVFAFSSQAKGFFAKAVSMGIGALNQKAATRFAMPENMARLERVREFSVKRGLTPTAVALGYITCNRVPAVAIAGCKNEAQMLDTLTAADVDITAEDADWLFRG